MPYTRSRPCALSGSSKPKAITPPSLLANATTVSSTFVNLSLSRLQSKVYDSSASRALSMNASSKGGGCCGAVAVLMGQSFVGRFLLLPPVQCRSDFQPTRLAEERLSESLFCEDALFNSIGIPQEVERSDQEHTTAAAFWIMSGCGGWSFS